MPSAPNIDRRWDQAIELLLAGASQKLTAERLGVHRNTVRNWMRESSFRRELTQRADERMAAVKLRRSVHLERQLDHVIAIGQAALDSALRDPLDRRAQRAAFAWLRMYRKLCAEQRLNEGLVVQTGSSAR